MTEEKLPEGWVWTTLGEIRFDLGKGIVPGNFPEQFFELYSVPNFDLRIPEILQGRDIKSNKQVVDIDTVLLCKINPRLNRAWVVGNFSEYLKIASTEWISFFNISMILPTYLRHYLVQLPVRDYFAANASGVGGSLMRINDRTVDNYHFPLAPLPEQNRIVAAIEQQFTRLDSAIASLESAKARIKQYRASLLKSAVEGELTKDWRAEHPASETGAQLLARILAERRARWEEEQLAKMREKGITPKDDKWKQGYKEPEGPNVETLPTLPDGWCWATVEQLVARSEYGTSVKCDYKVSGIPVLRIPNIAAGEIDLGDLKYTVQPIQIDEDSALQVGDLLVCRTNGSINLIGKAALVRKPLEPFHSFASYLLRFRLVERDTLPQWLYLFIGSLRGRAFIEKNSPSSAGQHNISLSLLHSMPLPLPSLVEQEQIVLEVESNLSNIVKLEETAEHSLKRAEHERQSILQEAFAGRLVAQDPDDEPASVLLARIREERKRREEIEKVARTGRKGSSMGSVRRRRAGQAGSGQQTAGVYEKLVEAGQPLPPGELFRRVNLKAEEQSEAVEMFYQELDIDVEEGLIEVRRPDDEQVFLVALEAEAEAVEPIAETKPVAQPVVQPVAPPLKKQGEQKVNRPTLWDI